jgi:hypothetical protein
VRREHIPLSFLILPFTDVPSKMLPHHRHASALSLCALIVGLLVIVGTALATPARRTPSFLTRRALPASPLKERAVTNAQRLALGLGPLKPKRMYTPTGAFSTPLWALMPTLTCTAVQWPLAQQRRPHLDQRTPFLPCPWPLLICLLQLHRTHCLLPLGHVHTGGLSACLQLESKRSPTPAQHLGRDHIHLHPSGSCEYACIHQYRVILSWRGDCVS